MDVPTGGDSRAARRLRGVAAHLRPAASGLAARGAAGGNRQMVIASVPKGPLRADNFAARDGPVPAPKAGEVRVRTLALTIGAGQRAGLQGSASYAGAPKSGIVMGGSGVGRVEESRDPAYRAGDVVFGATGWQQLAALPGRELIKVPPGVDPATQLGVLGTNGLTAYFGLLEIGAPKPGDTVVVSGAAGSVGHIVGQIAKIKGARVVGIAGSDAKCARLVSELGFDVAVNYKSASFRDDFKKATPKRIDVYFDNTGGPILQAALFRMNTYGRIVCCGNVSQYDTATPGPGPRGIPGLLVNNQVKMQGFIVYSYAARYAAAREEMSAWIAAGRLRAWATVYDGLERAGQAFVDLLNGVTTGTTVVKVAP